MNEIEIWLPSARIMLSLDLALKHVLCVCRLQCAAPDSVRGERLLRVWRRTGRVDPDDSSQEGRPLHL